VSKKRKRRKDAGSRTSRATDSPAEDTPAEPPSSEREPADASAQRRPGLFGGGTPSPFPSFAVSVAAGIRAVGASPLILSTAFLSLLATWGVLVAAGVEVTPQFLSVLLSVPPANLFSDVPVAFNIGESPAPTIAAVAGLGLLRTVSYGLLIILMTQALREGRPKLGAAIRRLPRVVLALFSIYLLEVGLVVVVLQVLAGFLGQLSILGVIALIYFLVFAPIVGAAEGAPMQEALRRGFGASRLAGTRHLALVTAYFLFLFWVSAISPFGPLAPATPGVATWAFALVATFIHVGILGAFVFRWVAVREQVPTRDRRPAGRSARSR
jgi:hypothetical protein